MGERIGRVMAHVAVVTNLDQCIGCRDCSAAYERARANRRATVHGRFDEAGTPGPADRRRAASGRLERFTASAEPEPPLVGDGLRVSEGGRPLASETAWRLGERVRSSFEEAFMLGPPRVRGHCRHPFRFASRVSDAAHRSGWDGLGEGCLSGCRCERAHRERGTAPAEECPLCRRLDEAGPPTRSATCLGRRRYLGVVLYDVDRVGASAWDGRDPYRTQLRVFLDPEDPRVRAAARRDGLPERWIESARRSPVRLLAERFGVALPLRPEYRTMPMLWHLPPLTPLVDALADAGYDGEDAGSLLGAIGALRAPVEYLAELFTAGDPAPVERALRRLAAMRSYMRGLHLRGEREESIAAAVGMEGGDLERMHRLLALARLDERCAAPTAYGVEEADREVVDEVGRGLDFDGGPGAGGRVPSGEAPGLSGSGLEAGERGLPR